MSEFKRLPDATGWWYVRTGEHRRGEYEIVMVRITAHGEPQYYAGLATGWLECHAGQWLPCPVPAWPPEPPPRPKMVFAMTTIPRDRKIGPCWWVRVDFGWRQLHYDLIRAYHELIPHDHPEQSAEESWRMLEEASRED